MTKNVTRTCPVCGNMQPDYWSLSWDYFLLLVIGIIVWPMYLRRPRDFFRDMRKGFVESKRARITSLKTVDFVDGTVKSPVHTIAEAKMLLKRLEEQRDERLEQ